MSFLDDHESEVNDEDGDSLGTVFASKTDRSVAMIRMVGWLLGTTWTCAMDLRTSRSDEHYRSEP